MMPRVIGSALRPPMPPSRSPRPVSPGPGTTIAPSIPLDAALGSLPVHATSGPRNARMRVRPDLRHDHPLGREIVAHRSIYMNRLAWIRKLDWPPGFAQLGKAAFCLGIFLALAAGPSAAWGFDKAGYKVRAEATLAELNSKKLADSKATLARLDEMIAMGIVGMKEYGAKNPKYAKLMDAAAADCQAIKSMTDVQMEEKWGETGSGGDAVGVPLKDLAEFGVERAYLELGLGPAHQYIFVKKWETAKKPRWLEQARDEAVELLKHLNDIPG
jgi:hypothetical protein